MKLYARLVEKLGNRPVLRHTFKYTTVDVDGFRMRLCIHDGGISETLYHHRGRERCFLSVMKRLISDGDVCLDIGANIGYTSLHMLRSAGKSGFVYAVEPDPHNVGMLKRNIRANGFADRCEIARGIISDRNGIADFWISNRPNLHSVQKTVYSSRNIRVDAFHLPTFLANRRLPNLIKMDVEGHEVPILRSSLEFFRKTPGKLHFLIEVHPLLYWQDNDFASVLREYFRIGFTVKYVVSTPVPEPRLIREAGYRPIETVQTDGCHRGIYEGMGEEDLIRFACELHEEGRAKWIVRSFAMGRP